jgi:hypothetical protein
MTYSSSAKSQPCQRGGFRHHRQRSQQRRRTAKRRLETRRNLPGGLLAVTLKSSQIDLPTTRAGLKRKRQYIDEDEDEGEDEAEGERRR